jgi:hypothetical protein
MVDSPARIECEICGEQNTFDNASPSGVFSYSPCNGCGFPLLYRNTNPNQHALNRRTLEKYAEAAQAWGLEVKEDVRALQIENRELQVKNRELQSNQSNSLPNQALSFQNSTQTFENMLNSSQRMQKVEQYIRLLRDRLSALESDLSSIRVKASSSNDDNAYSETVNIIRSIGENSTTTEQKTTASHIIIPRSSNETSASRSSITESITESKFEKSKFEPLIVSSSRWISDYNQNPDKFSKSYLLQRAGATRATEENFRLGQSGEVFFKTGSGNYWMYSPEKAIAFLMPNHKTMRFITLFNQNIFDSLKICFQLTHDPSEGFSFTARSADFDRMEMVWPAVFDSIGNENEWKMREKGVLSFPLKSE